MSKPDTNQASEDRLDTDTQIMHKIDYILYSEHEQPFSRGDALLMLVRNQIQAHIRTEKLKLLDEVIHQSTVNLKSAKAVAGWAEIRKKQLEAEL